MQSKLEAQKCSPRWPLCIPFSTLGQAWDTNKKLEPKECPGQVLRLLAPILEKGPSRWRQEKRHQKAEVSQDSVTKSRRYTEVRRWPSQPSEVRGMKGRQKTVGMGEPGNWDGEGATRLARKVLGVSEMAQTASLEIPVLEFRKR